MKNRNLSTYIGVILLIVLEQAIKLYIFKSHMKANVPILAPILYFKPMFNVDYSWFNSMLQLGISKWIHIAVVSILSIGILLFYLFLGKRGKTGSYINAMFSFIFAGAICSLIDKIFWNGSLDYILLNGFFTFDLKDVYINVFTGLLLLAVLTNSKAFRQLEDKTLMKEFLSFIVRVKR